MKFADLNKEQIRKFNQLRRQPKIERKQENKRPKTIEPLTKRDWLKLMGTNRDTYKRVNGAVRRK
ncbi:hypothetical protein [Cytobacillus firmus]|uniref:hypothetical protein n=1 Tax=Cytobacillus firmus TaxID=1399 RepID=UPI001CFDC251|nr:hypothetical protein [Cytobacillus firmus]